LFVQNPLVKEDLRSSAARKAMNDKQTQDKGSEPEDHGEKGESLSSFPLTTVVAATK
jgi:hypothetical protein